MSVTKHLNARENNLRKLRRSTIDSWLKKRPKSKLSLKRRLKLLQRKKRRSSDSSLTKSKLRCSSLTPMAILRTKT